MLIPLQDFYLSLYDSLYDLKFTIRNSQIFGAIN